MLTMPTQLISYDLIAPGKDYQKLFDAIQALSSGTWWRCLDSTWIIETDLASGQVLDRLRPHIDKNDRMLVVKLAPNWSSIGISQECTDWLRDHVAR